MMKNSRLYRKLNWNIPFPFGSLPSYKWRVAWKLRFCYALRSFPRFLVSTKSSALSFWYSSNRSPPTRRRWRMSVRRRLLPPYLSEISCLHLRYTRLHLICTNLSAGTLCFLVDKIVYGFSYHYILLNHFVVVDLGFFYLMLGACVLFQAIVYDIAWNKLLEKLMINRSVVSENPKV
jgi:hypothetical protein